MRRYEIPAVRNTDESASPADTVVIVANGPCAGPPFSVHRNLPVLIVRETSRMSGRGNDVSVEVADDFVAKVEIHRPPDNYVDVGVIAALADAYEALERDSACRAIVLCSEGRH